MFNWFKKQKGTDFKVEKAYEIKAGGRYLFAITTGKPISQKAAEEFNRTLMTLKERLYLELEITSSFIVLDNGLDIKVMPSKIKHDDVIFDIWTDPNIGIQKWNT